MNQKTNEQSILVLQYEANDYDQHGYYSTHYWLKEPTLQEIATAIFSKDLETLEDKDIINVVALKNGKDIYINNDSYLIVKCDNNVIAY